MATSESPASQQPRPTLTATQGPAWSRPTTCSVARWLREAPHILEGPAVHPHKDRHLSGHGSAFPVHSASAGTTE